MTEKQGIDWNGLIKYPAIAISAVIFMWLTEVLVGIDFSAITKIGTDGIEFEKQQEKNIEVVSLFDDRISKIEGVLGLVKSDSSNTKLAMAINESEAAMENLATSSDAIAELSFKTTVDEGVKHTYLSDKEGYIWIGNKTNFKVGASRNSTAKVTAPKLNQLGGAKIMGENYFEQLQEGSTYELGDNMVLRELQPTNDKDYFFNKGNLGVIPRGTKVMLLGKPIAINRGDVVQYWAKIKVSE